MTTSKGLTLSAGGIGFTSYGGGSTPPLTVAGTGGAINLNSSPVTVTTTTVLAAGVYKLIGKNGSATVSGTPGTLTVNGSGVVGGATPTLQVVSAELWLFVPAITSSGTLSAFGTTYGTPSVSQNVSVSGTGLAGNITATAPTGFEVSSDNSTWGGTASFTPSAGVVSSATLYVRLAATAGVSGSYNSQNISLTSSGASTVNIPTAASGNLVSAKGLTITGLTGADKVYDGSASASFTGTAAYSGLANGESFSVSGTPAASFATAAVGTGKTITVTGYTAPSANYSLTQPTLSGSIAPNATLTLAVNTNTAAELLKSKIYLAAGLNLGSAVLDSVTSAALGSLSTNATKIIYAAGATPGADAFNAVAHDSGNASKSVQVNVTVNDPSASTYSGNLTIRQLDGSTVRVIISGAAAVAYKLQHTASLGGNPTWADLETFTMPATGVTNFDLGISYGTQYFRTVLP